MHRSKMNQKPCTYEAIKKQTYSNTIILLFTLR